ncbi:hypothetical protein Tco_0894955 [Tanacetum coccineum]|uniref:Uncharacterized protein n=1 Tax=Tanacetum coccineum TaxID=301880 RepID=A0ABQ5CGF7_9ASTR
MTGDENRTPHEFAAFKAFQRRNGPPGLNKERRKKGEKNKGKAACVKTETDPIPELTYEDFQLFLKHFSGTGNSKGTKLLILPIKKTKKKATHFEAPVVIPNGDSILVKGKGDYILPGGTKVNGVLYVLDFKCNLLSVSPLSRDLQYCISFFPDFLCYARITKEELDWCG